MDPLSRTKAGDLNDTATEQTPDRRGARSGSPSTDSPSEGFGQAGSRAGRLQAGASPGSGSDKYNSDYRARYIDEVAPLGIAGRLIKFTKDGEFETTDDGKTVPETSEFILLADDTLIGWIRFNGVGEAPDRVMGLLFDGFEMPPRESLGDLDQSAWELGLDQQPADPWQHQQCIVLQDTSTSELFTFSTSSRTGRRAVGNLLRHYNRMQKSHPDELPVVKLGKGGFQHKDSRVGWVSTPVFYCCWPSSARQCGQAGHEHRHFSQRRGAVLILAGR